MKKLVGLPVVFGLMSAIIALLANPYKASFKADETAISYLFAFAGVIWGLVTVTIWTRVDEEWKACELALLNKNKDLFFTQAYIEMDTLIEKLWKLFAFGCVLTFHLFHFDSLFLLVVSHFLVAFMVSIAVLFIKDRDNPLYGVVNLTIPLDWQ